MASSRSLDLLALLLPHLKAFAANPGAQDETADEALRRFAEFLQAHTAEDDQAPIPDQLATDVRLDRATAVDSPLIRTPTSIGRLYRYGRLYTKLALDGSPLQTVEEFGFLAYVQQAGPIRRTELFAAQVYEKSSGVEIVNRLLRRGFVVDQPHPRDARSKLVAITDAGRTALLKVFPSMTRVSRLVAGDLTVAELDGLAARLQQLDAFHAPIFSAQPSDLGAAEGLLREGLEKR